LKILPTQGAEALPKIGQSRTPQKWHKNYYNDTNRKVFVEQAVQKASMKDTKQTIRITCYIPVEVKKKVQEIRAKHPSTSPPPENSYFLQALERGLVQKAEYPGLFAESLFRIDKADRTFFVPFGITMSNSLHAELSEAVNTIKLNTKPGHEPVNFRFIDLVACLLTLGLFW